MAAPRARTLGELEKSGWKSRSVRDEARANLSAMLRAGKTEAERWPGIVGYGRTVLPAIENAILSRHDFILLGLRGQAKTRLLRMLVNFLDPWLPALAGCDLNDDPLAPVSGKGRRLVEEAGAGAPVVWIPREERYREKLATPDATIADLLGDVDPIKAASRRLSLADEEALHFGIIPRTNRGIFAINELPDLSPRIQVGLLNILEERDVQLRGYPVRFPLDVLLVFSANPEDYTNRGAIITPLRDRISSQILTHYPKSIDAARAITDQEAWTARGEVLVRVPDLLRDVVEEAAFRARESEFVDQSSGVSVRLTISLLENVISNVERRALRIRRERATARLADLFAAQAAVTGKVELVYEGEREGPAAVADRILGDGVSAVFLRHFPPPYSGGRPKEGAEPEDVYKPVVDWFAAGNTVVVQDESDDDAPRKVPTLEALVRARMRLPEEDVSAACELVLEGLHRASLLAKDRLDDGVAYGDMLKRMFAGFHEA
ncbi:MAG: magnesium chelatase [Planctomycetota bacterium]